MQKKLEYLKCPSLWEEDIVLLIYHSHMLGPGLVHGWYSWFEKTFILSTSFVLKLKPECK